jgi:hypothetical protein
VMVPADSSKGAVSGRWSLLYAAAVVIETSESVPPARPARVEPALMP